MAAGVDANDSGLQAKKRVNDTSQRLEEERVIIREDSWVLMDWKMEGMWCLIQISYGNV